MPDTLPAVVFFDLDDTLLDDDTASTAGVRALTDRLGHPDPAAARHLWDVQTDISFGAYIAGRLTLEQQRRERVRALATQAGHAHVPDARCDELYQSYFTAHRSVWRAFGDVAPALDGLAAAGVRLGVITNGVEQLQREKLDTLGITQCFAAIVCAGSNGGGAGKPDPGIFHHACSQLGVAPHRCWHIGDQVRADALGALSAGMRAILLDRHGRHDQDGVHGGITTVRGLDEVAPMTTGPTGTARAAWATPDAR